MADYSLLTGFEKEGEFWLPERPDDRIRGVLKFVPGDETMVRLSSQFMLTDASGQLQDRFPLMLGTLMEGPRLTLLKPSVRQSSFGCGFAGPCTMHVSAVLVGEHFLEPSSTGFARCQMGLTALETWSCRSPIDTDSPGKLMRGEPYTATYRRPRDAEFGIPSLDLLVRLESSFLQSPGTHRLQWECRSFLELVSKASRTLNDFLRLAWEFQNLFTLLVGQPVGIREFTLWPADAPKQPEPSADEVHAIFVQRVRDPEQDLVGPEVLLPLTHIRKDFAAILSRWFARSEQTCSARSVYFFTLNTPGLPNELRLLSLMRAVETYHRGAKGGTYLPQASYDALAKRIAAALPQEIKGDHRTSLATRIAYGNEFSLRKRLKSLILDLPTELREMVTGGREGLAGRLADWQTRETISPILRPTWKKARSEESICTTPARGYVFCFICSYSSTLALTRPSSQRPQRSRPTSVGCAAGPCERNGYP